MSFLVIDENRGGGGYNGREKIKMVRGKDI